MGGDFRLPDRLMSSCDEAMNQFSFHDQCYLSWVYLENQRKHVKEEWRELACAAGAGRVKGRTGVERGSETRKTVQKNLQKPQYRIEFYPNTETAVTNVKVVLSSILEVRHSITNVTLCIPITVYVVTKWFLLI